MGRRSQRGACGQVSPDCANATSCGTSPSVIEPEPNPYGDRAALLAALTARYRPLETHTRYRVITHPDAELATELDLDPDTPVIQHRRLTQTARGRLLMTETEAASFEIEQV